MSFHTQIHPLHSSGLKGLDGCPLQLFKLKTLNPSLNCARQTSTEYRMVLPQHPQGQPRTTHSRVAKTINAKSPTENGVMYAHPRLSPGALPVSGELASAAECECYYWNPPHPVSPESTQPHTGPSSCDPREVLIWLEWEGAQCSNLPTTAARES